MKKSLLLSAALLAAGAVYAQDVKVETVFKYSVENQVATPIPGLDGGWTGWNASNAETKDATATCSRFGVGYNGKILTTDHKKNAIIAIDGTGITTFKELPARTAERWNGTVVTTDDAGNVIINYNFTDAVGSAQKWGVIDKNGNLKEMVCSSSLANQGATGRVDVMGHIVGDVTSTQGAIGYVVTQSSGQVIKMMFTGNGTECIDINCAKAYDYALGALTAMGGNSSLTSVCPRFSTVEEIKAFDAPAFIIPLGENGNAKDNLPSIEEGWVGKFIPGWNPGLPVIGNRFYLGIAYFEVGGKSYIVRNYISPEFEASHLDSATGEPFYTKWLGVLNFGVWEYNATTNTAKLVAEWQESEYANGFGMGQLSAEVVDDNTVNVYTYASTGNAESRSGTVPGCYCAMVKLTFEGGAQLAGSGTEADPFLITTAQELEGIKEYMDNATAPVYYKLMNDIDMAGINHVPFVGSTNADFGKELHFDGNYHIISNLTSVTEGEEFYYNSLCGVLTGSVKNLGLVDVNIKSPTTVGVGGIGGYGAYTKGAIDNVYVTGKIESGASYAGGICGTNNADFTISNCYSQADVKAKTYAGGIVGRGRKNITIENSYSAGTITAETAACQVAATDKVNSAADATLKLEAVATVATAADGIANYGLTMSGACDTDLNKVATWAAFNEGKTFNDMPALNWQENAESAMAGDGTEANPYIIATANDLCNAYSKMQKGAMTYFKQTADIDMSGVTDWTAFNGFNGQYDRAVNYDGGNHVISNFAPTARVAANDNQNGYYCATLFGVLTGTVKNLAVIDADCASGQLEAGILGGFFGGSWVSSVTNHTLDNVIVTGKASNIGGIVGGMFGTTAADVNIINSYALVEVESTAGKTLGNVDAAAANAAGMIASLGNTLTLTNAYVQATVKGANTNLVANGGTVKATNAIAIGTGDAPAGVTVTDAATAAATIKTWDAFSAGNVYNGLPTLNWFGEGAGVDAIGDDDNAPVEYYNLQGIRVENPTRGLYIKRQGNKATKVVL